MIIAVTGHREEKILEPLEVKMFFRREFERFRPEFVIQGLANGVDLWAGMVAIAMNIPVISAKPWTTHKPRNSDRDLYEMVEQASKEVIVVTKSDSYPGPWVYKKRNEWMVDRADRVLAVWDGQPQGGTFNCYNYAHRRCVPVTRYNPLGKWTCDEDATFI